MPDSPAAAKRSYSLDPWRFIPLWGMLVAMGVMLPLIVLVLGGVSWAALRICSGFWVLAAVFYWFACRARIEISPAGIRAFVAGSWVRTDWANIARLNVDELHVGFITNLPVRSPGWFRRGGYFGGIRDVIAQRRYIPLDVYRWNFFHGDFVEEVERLAPHAVLRSELEAKYPATWKPGRWTPVE